MAAIYIKTIKSVPDKFYIGFQPTNPNEVASYRLGEYFIRVSSLDSARAIAKFHGRPVVECEPIEL